MRTFFDNAPRLRWPVACEADRKELAVVGERTQSRFAPVLVIDRSQLGLDPGGIGQANKANFGRQQSDEADVILSDSDSPPRHRRDLIDREARFLSFLARAAVWLCRLRVSQHFSTFYEASVRIMDA